MQKFIHSSKNGGFAYCYLAPQVDARIADLEKALREMSAMYPYVWDRVDGCLVCMPENVARFDAAHQQALNALMESVTK